MPRHHHHFFDHCTPDGQFAGMITEDMSDCRFGKPIPLAAPAGSVILMHCLTPHSSLRNCSEHPRRTLIFKFRAADAMPIYVGDMTATSERDVRPIQGKPARFARFGGPSPLIPRADNWTSLYDLQARAKEKK